MIGDVTADALHEEAYEVDPFPVWERLRHQQPLFHDTIDDRWLLTRYDDVVAVFRDHETYSTLPYRRIFSDVIGPTMVQMDGTDHDIRRAIVAPELVGQKLERNFMPLIERNVRSVAERLPASGRVDLIDRFTSRLPLLVIATILGLEERDHEFLYSVTGRVIEALAGLEPARGIGIAAHAELDAHIDAMIGERMEQPTTDLVSGIAHGQTETGERLSRREIASFVSLLLVAGGETTDRAMASFWYVLMQHPDVLEEARRDPALLDAAFTEFMRRDGVVVYEDRELIRDVELHGCELAAGQIVRVALISANNDETAFADPRHFDPHRADLHPGKESRSGGRRGAVASHVGFGVGKHFCIGYQLARAEVLAGVRELLGRLHEPRFAEGREPRLQIHWFHRYLDRLVIDYEARPV